MIARALGRLIVVPVGLLLAVLAASGVLFTLGLEVTTHTLSASPDDLSRLEILLDMGFGFVTLAAASSILPALLIVAVGEIARIRSALFYILGGGASLALLPFIAQVGTGGGAAALPTRAWTILATAGFAGGLVYWLVAGRRA